MSAQSIPILTLPVVAAGAIAANRFVKPTNVQAGADENTLGVSRSAIASGAVGPVDVLGTSVVRSGAAFADRATLKSDADGKAITWAAAGAKVALALQAAGAADELIEVFLIPNVA